MNKRIKILDDHRLEFVLDVGWYITLVRAEG